MMVKKMFLRTVFAVLALVLAASAVSAAELSLAPAAYDAAARVEAARNAPGSPGGGYMRSLMDRSHMKASDYSEYLADDGRRGALPSKYDLRTEGYMTPAKNQGSVNNCWTYSALGSIESIYKKKNNGTVLDLSEMHLTWFAFNTQPPFKTSLREGAFDNTAVALLSRWIGPVNEQHLPSSNTNPTGKYSDYPNRLNLQHAYFLGLEYDYGNYNTSTKDIRKQLLYDHGGISVGVNGDSFQGSNYNAATYSAYSTVKSVNHAVLLCGWDDNFPKENFTKTPPGDGAWLVKNSWGTSVGDEGYYWVSYHDASLCDGVAFITEETGNYDKNYTYDELGWCWSVGFDKDTAWMANVFRSGTVSEDLKAVSFYTTGNNADYEIKVYTGLTDLSNPDSGTLAATKSGKQTFGGYHTVELNSAVPLAAGTDFSVVVKVKVPDYNYPLAVEMPLPANLGNDLCDNASANRGESFMSEDGATWKNAAYNGSDVNVCVKAFTKTVGGGGDDDDDDKGGGGGGCNAGAGFAGLLFAAALCMAARGSVCRFRQ